MPDIEMDLCFFHGNGLCLTNLDATFTSQALFCVDRFGLLIFEFKNLDRANLYAFSATGAFVFVHSRGEHKLTPPFFIISTTYTSKRALFIVKSYALLHQYSKTVKSSYWSRRFL
jgi:hypothetical protein